MPEPKSFMEVLTESLDQWATKFVDQDGSAGQPSLGARMQEMEREIAILTESRDKLADELRERGQRIAAAEADRDLWRRLATERGLELQDAWQAFPESILWARAGKDSLPLTIKKFCEQWLADKELTTAATEAERKWEVRWENLRSVLIGNGLGIDDDTTDELLQALSTELTAPSTLRARVKSQQARLDDALLQLKSKDEAIERLRTDLTQTRQELSHLRNAHHEWVNGQREKPVGLNETLQRMNDVITMQIEALSPTKGTGKTVDIRRRRLAERSIQQDAEHSGALTEAAGALLIGELARWPWDKAQYHEIVASTEWQLHAAAFLIAHYDAEEASK